MGPRGPNPAITLHSVADHVPPQQSNSEELKGPTCKKVKQKAIITSEIQTKNTRKKICAVQYPAKLLSPRVDLT